MRSHRVPACVAALLLGATLAGAAQPLTGRHWVWFTDKGPNPPTGSFDDAPVYAPYLADVAKITEVHHVTRWFNGVSVTADEAQIERLRGLRFVLDVTPVGKWWRGGPPEQTTSPPDSRLRPGRTGALDYGVSFSQMHMVKADSLHLLGLTGAGVRIAVFDDGFNYLDYAAFDRLRPHIVARYDFIDQDTLVAFDPYYTDHGTEVLSCLAAYAPGNLIGPAYDAEFLLARTENDDYERPVEEDNWVAAAEWAVAKGANIISSSVGYNWFQNDSQGNWFDSSYTLAQMDGKTSVITRAAQKAAGRGVVVVNAAGNERNQSGPSNWYWHGKLLMPSDGDSVIAVGAVYANGFAASFTSAGPTADGRIKPDVSALGFGVLVADPSYPGYVQRNGTSYATPVIAGVVAQLLQAHPSWDPIAVRTALRLSGSQALAPDTLGGWGVIDGLRALAADSAIFGRVVVDQTGQPNFGAYVQLYDVRNAPVTYSPTSTDGWYRMERIPPGTYHVKGFRNTGGSAGAETTVTLPTLPREIHLRLRTSDTVANCPRPALWWVSDPFPNPANPATTIRFRVFDQAAGDRVCLSIHTPTGQIVREVSVPVEPSGFITWDGLDAQGREVASGVYLARVTFGNASVTRRVVLLR